METWSLQQALVQISGQKQLAKTSSKMALSESHKGSIKQTNTSQVIVSETVSSLRVQLSRQAKKTRFGEDPVSSTVTIPARQPRRDTSTRNRRKFKLNVTDSDLFIPIKTSESHNCHPMTLILPVHSLYLRPPLVSLLCLCPVPHLEAQVQRAPVQVALIVLHLRHPKAAPSCPQGLKALGPLHQPVPHRQCHQNCKRWSALSTPCSQVPERSKGMQ